MKSQTARRPESGPKRPARSNKSNKPKQYRRQTARFEGKRDGKPLIFGWGGHLSHSQKVQLQRRATWAVAITFLVLIVLVLVGFWVDFNIITPGLPITSVNGHAIPQSLYRKMVAFKAQEVDNQLNGRHGLIAQRDSLKQQVDAAQAATNATTAEINKLVQQINALKPNQAAEKAALNKQLAAERAKYQTQQNQVDNLNKQYIDLTQNTIPQVQQGYNQSQVGNDSAIWLQNDELIREWLANQSSAVQAQVNPSPSQLSRAMSDFKNNLPANLSYSAFLKQDGLSDSDVQAMMTVQLRRQNMQNYLASQIKSPAYQVLARQMVIDTQAHAQQLLNQLKHGADFAKLARANSSDANTSSQGGYMGWMARGQYAQTYDGAVVENWMFDPARKLNELSPVLSENGSYHIVQILGIDPSRPIDSKTLQSLKSNALSNWLLEQEALPSTHITPIDQNMLLDPSNMPPGLPAGAPASGPNGVPGGLPGGIPGSGAP